MRPLVRQLAAFALLVPGLEACSGEGAEEGSTAGAGAIVSVQAATFAKPEVGRLGGCTATLIAVDVIVTAASCFGHASEDGAARRGTFVIETAPGATRTFVVDRVRSLGGPAADDVALAHLAEAVPADVATPLRRAESAPTRSEPVSAWTYGCGGGADGKTSAAYRYADEAPPVGCPGAPRVTAEGRVFAIAGANASDATDGSTDVDLVARRDAIAAALASWGR